MSLGGGPHGRWTPHPAPAPSPPRYVRNIDPCSWTRLPQPSPRALHRPSPEAPPHLRQARGQSPDRQCRSTGSAPAPRKIGPEPATYPHRDRCPWGCGSSRAAAPHLPASPPPDPRARGPDPARRPWPASDTAAASDRPPRISDGGSHSRGPCSRPWCRGAGWPAYPPARAGHLSRRPSGSHGCARSARAHRPRPAAPCLR